MLSNALAQSGWTGPVVAPDNWRSLVGARLSRLDWRQAAADVQPFLERQADLALLAPESFSRLLARGA